MSVNGGNNFFEAGFENWTDIFQDGESTNFGSMAYNPDNNLLGSTFVKTLPGGNELTYVAYDAGFLGIDEVVDNIGVTEEGEWIGTNQLAYSPAGMPAIVYTVYDGTSVSIKCAYFDEGSWQIELVSEDPSTPTDLDAMISVDLAFDSSGVPALCYNHIKADSPQDVISMRFAIRGS